MHCEAGPTELCEVGIEPEQVSWKGACVIFDCRLANGRPRVLAIEDVDAGAIRHRFPARMLEKTQEGGLIYVTERVAVVRIHHQFD